MATITPTKPMRLIAKSTPGGVDAWRFVVLDIESGKVLPVSAEDKVIIEYSGYDQPIKATLTLLIAEVDVEAIAAIFIKSKANE